MKTCRLCKHPNANKNNYCEKCNLSFKDGAVRKKYYNEKERVGKSTRGSKKLNFLSIVGICIIVAVSIGSYMYLNKNASTYNQAVELWNDGEIKAAIEVAKDVSENSRQYKDAQILIKNGEDYFLYSKAVDLWNDGDIKAAVEIAKDISENSGQYKNAQKLIESSEDYFLYSEAIDLWNERNYEEAIKILNSFPEDSEYYMQAQNVLNDM